jgi:hypothetical protein
VLQRSRRGFGVAGMGLLLDMHLELVQVLRPQGLVVWSDDAARDAVLGVVDSPSAVLAAGTETFPDAPVAVTYGADSDGESAVVLGARLAGARGVPLQLASDGKRGGAIRSALEARGIRVTDPAQPDPETGLTPASIEVGPVGGSAAVGVKAEPAAVPVDFSTVALGAAAEV